MLKRKKIFHGLRLQVEVKPSLTKVSSYMRVRYGKVEKVQGHFRGIGSAKEMIIRIAQ